MKNAKFSGPLATALMAALLDVIGILFVFLLLGVFGFKTGDQWALKILNVLFVSFWFPFGIFNPLLWAVAGFVFYFIRRNIRNGGLHIAR